MSGNRPDAATVAAALTADIERLAVALLGERNCAASTRATWRWGSKGSLALEISGPKRGIWHDHETDVGGDALDLVAHVRRCDTGEAWRWSLRWLGHDGATNASTTHRVAAAPPMAPHNEQQPERSTLALARQIWSEAVAPRGSILEIYLRSRGLRWEPRLPIRFHPNCPRDRERLPAMLAMMKDPVNGAPCGVHRTFLRADGAGKADGVAKMMCGNAGIIRLVPDDEVSIGLGIAEGIETSLSIMQVAGWRPVWAACSSGGIGRFPVLPGIEALTIFPDADDKGAGIKAARECAKRWQDEGREVTLRVPPAGSDWNDIARRAA